jgi:hypothetical protein
MTKLSPNDLAREYVARLENYLAGIDTLPARAGKVNVSAVAEACGFDRQILYKNQTAKALLEKAVKDKGLAGIETRESSKTEIHGEPMVPATKLREEQRRSAMLERRLSEMTARNADLSTKIRRLQQIEDTLILQGRRASPGPSLFDTTEGS